MLSTTELLVEHIISGVLALVWLLCIIICITGVDPAIFTLINSNWAISAILITALAYPLGMYVDTLADKLLSKKQEKIKDSILGDYPISKLKILADYKDSNINSYFVYNRFKERITRSSGFNFLMLAISIPILVLVRGNDIGVVQIPKLAIITLIVFGVLTLWSYFIWKEVLEKTYQRVHELRTL